MYPERKLSSVIYAKNILDQVMICLLFKYIRTIDNHKESKHFWNELVLNY